MTYRHYTKEYREQIVDGFHSSGMKLHKFVKTVNISARTLYVWLEADGRPFKLERDRIKTNCKFSFETKIKAIEQVLQYKRYPSAVAPEFGVTFAMLYRWLKTYKEKGEYALMGHKDIVSGKISNEASLLAENEKLRGQNLKLKMKIDAYEMAQELLKNYPALSWSESLQDLTNPVKIELIKRLRAKFKYKVKDLLDLFVLKDSSYHTGKNAVKQTEAWQNRWSSTDEQVLEFVKADKNIYCKQGRREILPLLKAAGIEVSEWHFRKIVKDNNLQAWQTKSMKKHSSYKNDGNPPVKNWLYDSKTKVHYFSPQNTWELLGTDVTEIHINGFVVYLSMIIDFYDGAPVTWKMSNHPNTELIVGSVYDLAKMAPADARFVLHMDRGSINRGDAMKTACLDNHTLQSMSRKGKSGDNAPTEGFFGQMKRQWFNKTDFTGMTFNDVVDAWNDWLNWYCEVRPKMIYSGLSVKEGRNVLQYRKVA